MLVGVFEDEDYNVLYPISYTKPVYEIRNGIFNLRERICKLFESERYYLFMRSNLARLYKWLLNIVYELKNYRVNEIKDVDSDLLIINGRIILTDEVLDTIDQFINSTGNFIGVSEDYELLFLKITPEVVQSFETVLLKPFHLELFSPLEESAELVFLEKVTLLKTPLDLLNCIEYNINFDWKIGDFKSKLMIDESAKISEKSTFDTERGPIVIDEGVEIKPGTYIIGPAYIGKNAKIVNSLIKSSVICEDSLIYNSSVEDSLILDHVVIESNCSIIKSIIGSWSRILASSLAYGRILEKYFTEIGNEGVVISDFVTILPSTVIYPGSQIGLFSIVSGTINEIVKHFEVNHNNIKRKLSLNETLTLAQGRMRDFNRYISDYELDLIKLLYEKLVKQ